MPKMREGEGFDIDIEFLGIASISLKGFDVMLVNVVRSHDDGFPSHAL